MENLNLSARQESGLPVELWDDVLDGLQDKDSKPALLNFSTTSRYSRNVALPHVFREVTVFTPPHKRDYQAFLDFLTTSPNIARLIRELKLAPFARNDAALSHVYLEDVLEMLRSLPELTELLIYELSLTSRGGLRQASCIQPIESIDRLTLYLSGDKASEGMSCPHEGVVILFSYFKRIRHLNIGWFSNRPCECVMPTENSGSTSTYVTNPAMHPDVARHHPPRPLILHRLQIRESAVPYRFLVLKIMTYISQDLSRVDLTVAHFKEGTALYGLVQFCGTNLVNIQLKLDDTYIANLGRELAGDPRTPPDLLCILAACPLLESFGLFCRRYIGCSGYADTDFTAPHLLRALLSQTSATSIRHISLVYRIIWSSQGDGYAEDVAQSDLVSEIDWPGFRNAIEKCRLLQTFSFIVMHGNLIPGPEDPGILRKAVERYFGEWIERRVLDFSWRIRSWEII